MAAWRRLVPALSSIAPLLLAAGCDAPAPPADDAGVALVFPSSEGGTSLDPQAIFAGCAGDGRESLCHSEGAGGFFLGPAAAGRDTLRVPATERPELLRVAPGDPDHSYLLRKVEGGPDLVGARMGAGDPAVAAALRRWIAAGAPAPP